MKFFLGMFILAVFAACSLPQQPSPTPRAVDGALFPTATPPPTRSIQNAETEAPPPLAMSVKWSVAIIQNGEVLTPVNSEIHLGRLPFTIHVSQSRPIDVALNVLDTDDNFRKVRPGSYAFDECKHEWQTFCTGAMSLADPRFNKGEYLYIDTVYHEAYHWLYYNSPDDHRWSRVEITDEGAVFERKVSYVRIYRPSGTTSVPIESYTGKLYLLFMVKYRSEQQISDDELKKIVLSFQEP